MWWGYPTLSQMKGVGVQMTIELLSGEKVLFARSGLWTDASRAHEFEVWLTYRDGSSLLFSFYEAPRRLLRIYDTGTVVVAAGEWVRMSRVINVGERSCVFWDWARGRVADEDWRTAVSGLVMFKVDVSGVIATLPQVEEDALE